MFSTSFSIDPTTRRSYPSKPKISANNWNETQTELFKNINVSNSGINLEVDGKRHD